VLRRPAAKRGAVELDRSGRGPYEPGDRSDRRRLAGAVRTDDADAALMDAYLGGVA